MHGTASFTVLMGILATLLWVKFWKDHTDGSPSTIWLPVSVTVTAVLSLGFWIFRRRH